MAKNINIDPSISLGIKPPQTMTLPDMLNFARGMQVPINESFKYLKSPLVTGSVLTAAWMVGAVCLFIAFIALYGMRETFDQDLDYVESI